MSTNRPPHPNGNPHDHDLQPERWADASLADADALDALLNEIAQGNGFPSTRSGHGRQRPDARSDDGGPTGEAAALHAAARSFHRRFDAAQGRDPGSAALDPHLWEQIMTGTTNPAPQTRQAQGAWWRDAARNALAPGSPTRSQHHPTQRWAPVANATLALVILLAGFGVWRVYDGLNGSGPADPEGTTPGVAMRPAIPEATEFPPAEAPPAATPAPISACDFSTDIPLIPDVDESPVDGTALLLTTDGDLVLICPEEPDLVVLASDIDHASPLGWPGIVSLTGEGEPGSEPISVFNVITGRSIPIGRPPDAMAFQWTQLEGTPWLVAPSDEDTSDWAITDLRTMESRLYSEFFEVPLREGTILNPTANGDDGGLVIASWSFNSDTGTGAVTEDAGQPGNLLVFDDSLDEAHVIELPAHLTRVTEIRLSPNGQHVALRTTTDGERPNNSTTYFIIRVDNGNDVARTDAFEDPASTVRWVQDGNALAYTQHTSLMLLSAESGTEPVTLLEGNDALVELGATYDPDVVIVQRQQADEVAAETPGPVQSRISSVNAVTGEVIDIDGVDVSQNISPWSPGTRFLVMGDTNIQHMNAETASFRVVDAVTGEVLDELPDIQLSQDPNGPMMELRSVASTADGGTEVIGFGASQLYLLRDVQGTLEMRQLPSPNADVESYIGSVPLGLASDGSQLSLAIDGDESGTRYMIDLNDPDASWIAVPSAFVEPGYGPQYIFFVRGTGS